MTSLDRRGFLRGGIAAGALLLSPAVLRDALAAPARAGAGPYGPLQDPDALGLMLPKQFTGRQIARGGQVVGGTNYPWHFASDGQATYATADGGWILVSNSEAPAPLGGGSSAIGFGPDGTVRDARRILAGTNLNCAGGPTPWGTWLSCEEHDGGMVWEADPTGASPALPRPALGNFAHEAAAVDPADGAVYLTEDESEGLLYRFRPATPGDLSSGVLEAAAVAADGTVTWHRVPDPNVVTQGKLTREQVPAATRFSSGEGLWHHDGTIYFTTKGDRRVWAYDARAARLEVLYDYRATPDAALNAVDNVTVSPAGDVFVCEDGGNMEICLISHERQVAPFVRLVGHDRSELAGVVFDPSGTRMYFASQRAFQHASSTPFADDASPAADGAVYEVTGPFRAVPPQVADRHAFHATGAPITAPLGLRAVQRAGGVRVQLGLDAPATVDLVVRTSDLRRAPWPSGGPDRPVSTTLAARRLRLGGGRATVDLPLPPLQRGIALLVTAVVAGGPSVATRVA